MSDHLTSLLNTFHSLYSSPRAKPKSFQWPLSSCLRSPLFPLLSPRLPPCGPPPCLSHRSSYVSHKHQPLSRCIYSSLPRLVLPQMSTQYFSSPSVLPSGVTSVRPSPITLLLGGWDFGLFCSLPCPQSLEQSLPILGA